MRDRDLRVLGLPASAKTQMRCCTADINPTWWCGEGKKAVFLTEATCSIRGTSARYLRCEKAPAQVPSRPVARASENAQPATPVRNPVVSRPARPSRPEVPKPEYLTWQPAQDFPSVDYRPQLLPQQHQGISGWCFAYSAADQLAVATGVQVSPVDLALSYNRWLKDRAVKRAQEPGYDPTKAWGNERELKRTLFSDLGNAEDAIQAGLEHGMCLNSDLPGTLPVGNNDDDWGSNYSFGVSFQFYLFKRAFEDYPNAQNVRERERIEKEWIDATNLIFPRLGFARILSLVEQLRSAQDPEKIAIQIRDESCGSRMFRPNQALSSQELWSYELQKAGTDFARVIDYLLSHQRIAGLSVQISDINHWERDSEGKNRPGGAHALTIVAREMRGGQCKYLMRNSYGTRPHDYDHSFEQEGGNAWLTADQLNRAVWSIDWIK
jgi:hypothetical protein